VRDGKLAGASGWITKPVNADLLWKAIELAVFKIAQSPTPSETKASER
jgi:hypothetical protein